MFSDDKDILFSGIQPSGEITIGNYFGALINWVKLQDEYNCIYCLVDMHAITVPQDPATLRARTLSHAALLLACGIDPEKSLLFIQSHVQAHAQLGWILNCNSYMGELGRMTQFKDKSAKLNNESIRVGLFDYPVLMAADILLYKSKLVPVGEDQRQHLELTRDIAVRFNQAYGEVFPIPDAYIPKEGAKILSLQDPQKKMSKSDENAGGYVMILDSPDTISAKFRRAVTDSGSEVRYDPKEKPGISNLLEIYALSADVSLDKAQESFASSGYGAFKAAVGDALIAKLGPIQREHARYLADPGALSAILASSAQKARELASATVREVEESIGFLTQSE